ncbi:MAG: SMI1/KNR4 family protein [Anaerolineales bacterium]
MTAKIINANPYGPLSQKKIEEFERATQVNLPKDYQDFLLKYNGGRPVPSFFWIEQQKDGSAVYQFYGLHAGPRHLSIETFAGQERYGVPSWMLPIGDDGVGNFIGIGTSSANFGNIYFLDHDLHSYQTPNSSKGITKLSDSFTEFLNSLIENPE